MVTLVKSPLNPGLQSALETQKKVFYASDPAAPEPACVPSLGRDSRSLGKPSTDETFTHT